MLGAVSDHYAMASVDHPSELRRQVLRRVRYATNVLALENDVIPPEGPFDAGLTNGLLAIVHFEWSGKECNSKGFMRPASELPDVVHKAGGLPCVEDSLLREGLELTQTFHHGRADDEFALIHHDHVGALRRLDDHEALSFIETARGLSLDESVVEAYRESMDDYLPFDLKDRSMTPEPEECPQCWRTTFHPAGRDEFGGTITAGACIACGYERDRDEAYEEAVLEAMKRASDE